MVENVVGTFREGFATAIILMTALFLGFVATGHTVQSTDNLSSSEIDKTEIIDGFYDTQVLQDNSGLVTYFPINLDQERILQAGLILTYESWKNWQFTGETRAAEFRQTGFYEGVDFGNSFKTYRAELGVRGKLPKGIRMQLMNVE